MTSIIDCIDLNWYLNWRNNGSSIFIGYKNITLFENNIVSDITNNGGILCL